MKKTLMLCMVMAALPIFSCAQSMNACIKAAKKQVANHHHYYKYGGKINIGTDVWPKYTGLSH